ncbi:MAG: hypothetical protein ACPLRO_07725, partial [Candidatus Kapaibacteriota bacterium]
GKVFLARTLRIPNSTIEIETRKELPFYQQPKLMQDKNHQTDFVSTFVFVDFKYISDTCELK